MRGPEWGEWQWGLENRFQIFRKFSPQDLVSDQSRGGERDTGSIPSLSQPVSLIHSPAFPAHALVSALRNLPLDSDQESQEARLPERGTELPAAHWHPRRWDLGLRLGPGKRAWREARASGEFQAAGAGRGV